MQCFFLHYILKLFSYYYTFMCYFRLFTQINNKNPDYTEIEFFEDGNWKPRRDDDDNNKDGKDTVNINAIGLDGKPLHMLHYIIFLTFLYSDPVYIILCEL